MDNAFATMDITCFGMNFVPSPSSSSVCRVHIEDYTNWTFLCYWQHSTMWTEIQLHEFLTKARCVGYLLFAVVFGFGSLCECFICSIRASAPKNSLWHIGHDVAFGPPMRAACCCKTPKCNCNSYLNERNVFDELEFFPAFANNKISISHIKWWFAAIR